MNEGPIDTVYPCCGRVARFRKLDLTPSQTFERRHFCADDDTTGTYWRIRVTVKIKSADIVVHEVEWLDMASREARQRYGDTPIPRRERSA